jgi:hypothetical protein
MIERMQHAMFPAVQRRRRSKAWKGVRAACTSLHEHGRLPFTAVGHMRLQDHRTVQFIQFPEQRGELAEHGRRRRRPIHSLHCAAKAEEIDEKLACKCKRHTQRQLRRIRFRQARQAGRQLAGQSGTAVLHCTACVHRSPCVSPGGR